MTLVRLLNDGGARLLLGTDTTNPMVVPGFSVHEELENLVAAGLTPYRALKTGTSDAAEFLGQQREFGTVAVGLSADLVLVAGNPLQDVRNARKRAGVMVRGRWFSEKELQERLDQIATRYRKSS